MEYPRPAVSGTVCCMKLRVPTANSGLMEKMEGKGETRILLYLNQDHYHYRL
jgi:hypothetical protein